MRKLDLGHLDLPQFLREELHAEHLPILKELYLDCTDDFKKGN